MLNKDSITSIVVHLVAVVGVLLTNPMTGVLHSKPQVIMVKTYNLPETQAPEKKEPVPEPSKPKPVKAPKVVAQKATPSQDLRKIPDSFTRETIPTNQLHERQEPVDNIRRAEIDDSKPRGLQSAASNAAAVRGELEQRSFANENSGTRTGATKTNATGKSGSETVGDEGGAILASIAPLAASNGGTGRQTTSVETSQRIPTAEVSRASVGEANGASEGGSRTAADGGPSHIKLDAYHYQMVSVCLRLCAKSMFTHEGLDMTDQATSHGWLRVHNDKSSYFEFNYHGRWMRFDVSVRSLGDISTLDYVNLSSAWAARDDAESLLEDMTRKLCGLLGYENCFSKL